MASAVNHVTNCKGGASHLQVFAPTEVPQEYKYLLQVLKDIGSADPTPGYTRFDDDAELDVPILYVQGRDRIRVVTAIVNYFMQRKNEAQVVLVHTDDKLVRVEIRTLTTIHFVRHWYMPHTYLLPDFPTRAVFIFAIKPWTERVVRLTVYVPNWLSMPLSMRCTLGWIGGTLGVCAEQAVRSLQSLANQYVYQQSTAASKAN